ncbi:MAG: hypothetical protein STSR0004_16610 [Peptococcaceae bacterium]
MEKYKLLIFPSGSNGIEEDVGLGLENNTKGWTTFHLQSIHQPIYNLVVKNSFTLFPIRHIHGQKFIKVLIMFGIKKVRQLM